MDGKDRKEVARTRARDAWVTDEELVNVPDDAHVELCDYGAWVSVDVWVPLDDLED